MVLERPANLARDRELTGKITSCSARMAKEEPTEEAFMLLQPGQTGLRTSVYETWMVFRGIAADACIAAELGHKRLSMKKHLLPGSLAGRILSRRVLAVERLRSPRHQAALVFDQYRPY